MIMIRTILSFITVAFLLTLFGKVNKVDLYHAYFRTIQDVEVRNSTGLEVIFSMDDAVSVKEHIVASVRIVLEGSGLLSNLIKIPDVPLVRGVIQAFKARKTFVFRMHYQLSHPHFLP